MRRIAIGLGLGWTLLASLVATPAQAACTGDCGGDGQVTVDEILVGVNIALGTAAPAACGAMDANSDGQVTVDEVVGALNGALNGCLDVPPTATPTATATATQAVATPPPACNDSDGTASLRAGNAVPASGSGGLDASCVKVENAGGTRSELTRVGVRGTVGGVPFLLQVYFVTATGAVDTVSYGWSPDPILPDFFEAMAFCNAPDCAGAGVDLGSRTVTLNGVGLGGDAGNSAVLNGTIVLDEIPVVQPTPTPLGCPGGSAELAFSEVVGTNSLQTMPVNLVLGSAQNFSSGATSTFSAAYEPCPSAFPRFTLSFQYTVAELTPGASFELSGASGVLNQIEFRDEGFSRSRSWKAGSGTLVIDAVEANHISFRLVDARMRSNDFDTKGTFTLNVRGNLAR